MIPFTRFAFDATRYVAPGYENAAGDYDAEIRSQIAQVRSNYPELSEWGDMAVGVAWGEYSEQVHMISWIYWGLNERDEDFLNFLCWQQTRGPWKWGDDKNQLSAANEWRMLE